MRKIATTGELQAELTRLLRYASADRPSRVLIARELERLAARVAVDQRPAIGSTRADAERAMKKADAAEEKAHADHGPTTAQSAMMLCDAAVDMLTKAVKAGHRDLDTKLKHYKKRAKFWSDSLKKK